MGGYIIDQNGHKAGLIHYSDAKAKPQHIGEFSYKSAHRSYRCGGILSDTVK